MSDRRPSGAAGVLVVAAALLVAVAVLTVQWAGKDRQFLVSVPQSPPLDATPIVPVTPEREVCLEGVTIVPEGRVASVRVGTRGKPPVPLTATLSAPGYRETEPLGPTWKDNDLLAFRFTPPSRPVHGTFCLRNDGRRTVDVYASEDTQSILPTRVDGRTQGRNIQLTFSESAPSTLRRHAGDIADRLSLFRPGVIGPAVVWALFVLVLAGVPLGLGFAMWRAVREPDPASGSATGERGAQAGLDLPGGGGPRAARDEVAPGGRAR